jgi:hypothetical protein
VGSKAKKSERHDDGDGLTESKINWEERRNGDTTRRTWKQNEMEKSVRVYDEEKKDKIEEEGRTKGPVMIIFLNA